MQDRHPLFLIAGSLFLVDELVELGVAVVDAPGAAGAEILLEVSIGVAAVAAGIVERQLAAVDAFLAPVNGVLLRDQFYLDADFAELITDHFADLFAFEMAVRREVELDLEAVGVAGLGEQLSGLARIVGIARDLGVEADPVGAERPVHHRAVAVVDVLQHDVGIKRVVDRLAHQLVVEGLQGDIHAEKIHAKADDLLDPIARMPAYPVDVLDRHVADNVGLTGEQPRHPRRFFLHALENHFANLRFAAPIIIVAPQHEIAAALPADVLIWAGAVGVAVELIAGLSGDDVARVQARQHQRVGVLARQRHGEIVRRLDLDILHDASLHAALVVLQTVDGIGDVLGSKRRAVVKTDALAQMEHPPAPLKLPRLGEHTDILVAREVHLHQRLDHVAPDAGDAAAAVAVGMKRIQTDSLIDHYPVH